MKQKCRKWRFAVDRGGTFTDVIGLDPDNNYHVTKLLSDSPDYEDPSIEGIKRLLALGKEDKLPEEKIETIRFGTTIATNALLERKGGRVALFITKGFNDLLEIGNQARPELFDLCITKPSILYATVFEINERIDCTGNIITPPDVDELCKVTNLAIESGFDAVSIVFMHSWINPEHELICEEILKERGIENIFTSHKSMNTIKITGRGQSCATDAYLSPIISQYIKEISRTTGSIPIEFIRSSGRLVTPDDVMGKDFILSGPAGGVIAVAEIAKERDLKGAIGFDMGGTSTDVSRYDGEIEEIQERVISGIELKSDMLNIHTVASGGGSILWFDGQKLRAGPDSAGAFPGPACYGFGGPLTITDANLITGRLSPNDLPRCFGKTGKGSIDINIVKERFTLLAEEINKTSKTVMTPEEVALGFIRIANEKMALAIKEISVSKGYDVRDYSLICFGGAGSQHACQVAELLDMERIVIHPLASVMSAYGVCLSNPAKKSALSVLKDFDKTTIREIDLLFDKMILQLLHEGEKEETKIAVKREIDVRPKGAETYLTLDYACYDEILAGFMEKYKTLYGFLPENTLLEIAGIRVEVKYKERLFLPYYLNGDNKKFLNPVTYRFIHYQDASVKAPVYKSEHLPQNIPVKGPAIVADTMSVIVIDPGFEAAKEENGVIAIKRTSEKKQIIVKCEKEPDPVLLEVFNNIFSSIASEMGHTLRKTSISVNIRERLDYSCALFDQRGGLIANAPHIPVHLGSMSDTVQSLLKDFKKELKPGEIYLTNDPYRGGSHLPDLTVICPVFSDNEELIFFTAARGHHADIGGKTPGSLPPLSGSIHEEGVLIETMTVVKDGKFREYQIRDILLNNKYPVRNVEENIYDLKSQIASCQKGAKELGETIKKYGLPMVRAYMGHIQDNAEASIKRSLATYLKDNDPFIGEFEDFLDNETKIRVKITITGGASTPETLKATIDFTGTGQERKGENLNAPLSVTHSAVLYVLRLLTNDEIPLNSGCLKPVEIIAPEGTILNPLYPAPVAAGNVETSQRVVDVLLGAFDVAAASQGTMNNLLFEVEGDTPYYETIAGGSGASAECCGASGVQVHMTNTRITDPEILEHRHPDVMLEGFRLRKNSGGAGRRKGGDGIIREIKFLRPAALSIISERRKYSPYGLKGGASGKCGENLLIDSEGAVKNLPHRVVVNVNKGDKIVIKTPGGGGFGSRERG